MNGYVIPEMQTAVLYANPPSIETKLVEIPVPQPGAGQVLVKLSHSGVCHSDLAICTRFSYYGADSQANMSGRQGEALFALHRVCSN